MSRASGSVSVDPDSGRVFSGTKCTLGPEQMKCVIREYPAQSPLDEAITTTPSGTKNREGRPEWDHGALGLSGTVLRFFTVRSHS